MQDPLHRNVILIFSPKIGETMKKRLIFFLLFCLLALSLCGCTNEAVIHYKDCPEAYVKELAYRDGFTVLQLTDIHWSTGTQTGDESYGQERYIRKVINEAISHAGQIDLIEVAGDTFMLATKPEVNAFIELMADIGIPYALVWGNHDREGKYNPNWLTQAFMNAPCCLYTEVDNDDVHERSNYVINLTDDEGNTVWQIFNLDSGASYREGAKDIFLDYDYIREDQLEWLAYEHSLVGEDVPALCYYHIAQADNDALFTAVTEEGAALKHKFFKLEHFAASDYAGTTEEVFAANNVKAAFMGHAHAVDWTVTSESGIIYGMGVKTGTELYYGIAEPGYDAGFDFDDTFLIIGASLVTLEDTVGNLRLEHLYLNEREKGDFILWVEY